MDPSLKVYIIYYLLRPGRVRSIEVNVSVNFYVCLPVHPLAYLKTACSNLTKFFVHVACGRRG